MRTLGYILFILGFLWVTFIAVEVGPVARAMRNHHSATLSEQASYTRRDVGLAYQEAAYGVAHFAQLSLVGCLLIFAGSVILGASGKRDSSAAKPPVL
jgi:hypothetical protein